MALVNRGFENSLCPGSRGAGDALPAAASRRARGFGKLLRRPAWTLAALWLAWSVAVPVGASPKIQHWVTENGARVYFVEARQLPIVQLRLVFDAGSARDTDATSGLAALTNGLLLEGAGELDADAVAEGFEAQGAEVTASAGRDMAVVGLRSLSDARRLQPVLRLLRRSLTEPRFDVEALDRERSRSLVALLQESQNPGTVAQKLFYRGLYKDHPYARYPRGTAAGLKAVTREDVKAFHRRYYVARNAVLGIVGDVDRAGAERMAEDLFAGLPAGQRAPRVPPVEPRRAAREVRKDFPSSQTHLLIGQPGMRRGDPDYFPLYVGNYILGGGGLVSRLFGEVREKQGLAYSAYSYFIPMRRAGPYVIGLQTRNAETQRALKIARQTVREFVENGPTAAELEAARKNLTGGFPLRIDSNQKIVGYLALIGFYDLPLDYLDTFTRSVEAVTLDKVRDAFARRVDPQRMLTVIVGG